MTITRIDTALVLAPLSLTASALDSEDVYELVTDALDPSSALFVLDDGLSLSGLRFTENGLEYADDALFTNATIFVRCRVGETATIKHEDTGVSTATRRFTVKGLGADLVIDDTMSVVIVRDHDAQRWAVYPSVHAIAGKTGNVTLTASDVGADPAGTASGALAAHEVASDPHPQYTTAAQAASAAPVQSVNTQTGAVVLGAADVGAEPAGTAASAVAVHVATADPHPQYTTAVEAAAAAPVQSVNGQIGTVALTAASVGADPSGTASAAVATHVAAANPHPQYAAAPILRAHVFGSTVSPSKNTSTWATLPDLTATVSVANGMLDIEAECSFFSAPTLINTLVEGQVRLAIDGTPVANTTRTVSYRTPALIGLIPGETGSQVRIPLIRVTGLSSSVTVAVQWSVTSGTLVAQGTERSLRIVQP